MNNNKNIWKGILFCLVFFISFSTADALGVYPGQRLIYYEPGETYDLSFIVVNTAATPRQIDIAKEGSLDSIIQLDTNSFIFEEGEHERKINYKLSLPYTTPDPGDHVVSFHITENPSFGQNPLAVGATIELLSTVLVRVPYSGVHLDTKLNTLDVDEKGMTQFSFDFENRGSETIYDIVAELEILNSNGETVTHLKETLEELSVQRRDTLILPWKADVQAGIYDVLTTVSYGTKQDVLRKTFTVGEEKITLSSFEMDELVYGEVSQFTAVIKNEWSHALDQTFIELQIFDESGAFVLSAPTSRIKLGEGKTFSLEGFIDTQGLAEGSYTATLLVHYQGRAVEEELSSFISEETLTIREGEKRTTQETSISLHSIIFTVLLCLVFANIVWFFYHHRRS